MIEIFHNGKSTGMIVQDTPLSRRRTHAFIRRYNAHYGTNIVASFRKK